MKKLMRKEIAEKILKLGKFRRHPGYRWYIYIDGTGFRYDVLNNHWIKLVEPHIYTYPLLDDFFEKLREVEYGVEKPSSIDEVLDTVPDDILDTILFNINLFR